MRRSIYWIMAATAGVVVANNYYNQPLLVEFAKTFHVPEHDAGVAAIVTQTGYAFGLTLFVPLGDKVERRRLIRIMLALSALALMLMGLAPSLMWLIAASFLIGLTSITPQLLTPFAAHLAGPSGRGKAVGTVMFGLLCGILLSRTLSGFVGAHLGWRAMYWIASGAMLTLILVLWRLLPSDAPTFRGSYGALMGSLWTLLKKEPVIRETAAIAALQFAAFSAFWTTLAFHLYSFPAHFGSETAGAFGLVGVIGASAAPYAGKLTDKGSPRVAVLVSSTIFLLAYLIFFFTGETIAGLVAGVILLDLGMQSGHVSNMARNMSVSAAAMSRANTLYMSIRFAGGALGSAVGNFAWSVWRWEGVCVVGVALSVLAIAVQGVAGRRERRAAAGAARRED